MLADAQMKYGIFLHMCSGFPMEKVEQTIVVS